MFPNAISSSNSGQPARDRISLLTLCATPNDSATADVSRSPSRQPATDSTQVQQDGSADCGKVLQNPQPPRNKKGDSE